MNASDYEQIETDRIQEFFDAIKSGNLTRVKVMLVEDPGLLYAELEGDASAPREALTPSQVLSQEMQRAGKA